MKHANIFKNLNSNKLVAFEGIDGSTKNSQAKLLTEFLKNQQQPAKLYSFPLYEGTFYGKMIGAFLRGEYGTINEVDPKLAALLFALDRNELQPELIRNASKNIVSICDRYVFSNIAHQCSKLSSQHEANDLENWILDLEFGKNKLPKPDATIFLKLPPELARKTIQTKKERSYTTEKADIHEASESHLNDSFAIYESLAKRNDWITINCNDGDKIKDINQIHTEVLESLNFV